MATSSTRRFNSVLLIISGGGRRVRDAIAGLDARGDDRLFACRGAESDWRLHERRAVQPVDDRRAVALEDGFGGHEHDVGDAFDGDARHRAHARTDLRVAVDAGSD